MKILTIKEIQCRPSSTLEPELHIVGVIMHKIFYTPSNSILNNDKVNDP